MSAQSKPRARLKRPARRVSALPASYAPLLKDLKARVRTAQLRAAIAVNRELLLLYWQIGHAIAQAQDREGWGAGVIPRLVEDLRAEFPNMQGFSERNLKYMVRFAREYGAPQFVQPVLAPLVATGVPGLSDTKVQQPAALLGAGETVARAAAAEVVSVGDLSIVQPLVAQLPWAHHITLLERTKSRADRLWYMQAAVAQGWSRSMLAAQISAKAHRRAGRAITNFATTLPPAQSDLAQQVLKDPYLFDFLTLATSARERDLEQGLIDHIQKFLVALGVGFAFVGRQVHLEVGGEDYYLDLLFYHLKLRCFFVIELKVEAFKPEFAGKMNFYLSAVDAQLRHRDDQPKIGLLLCQANNRITVDYALRDVKKPIGVAQWKTKLVDSLPKNLRGALPTVRELEQELAKR